MKFMRLRFFVGNLATVLVATVSSRPASALQAKRETESSEPRISVGSASLQVRTIGKGKSVIVLHGGPDFDYGYLLPELDRFKDAYRLIYHDQRGRGKSADHVRPEDVTLASDVDDLDKVRQHFQLESPVLLVEIAERIARAIPNATFVTIKGCGHFAYLECGADVRTAVDNFIRRTAKTSR